MTPATYQERPSDGESRPDVAVVQGKTCILVLGMHRSGTSVLARLLNVFGADVGHNLLEPHERDNPTGFWEDRRIVAFNDALLAEFDTDYLVSRRLPGNWRQSRAARAAEGELEDLLRTAFSGEPLTLLKDPRLCFLGPLYLDILRRIGYEPRIVMPLRYPSEVAASLSKRHERPAAEFEAIWARTVLSAERVSRGCRRAFTSYADLLEHPEDLYDRLASALSIRWPTERHSALQLARGLVRRDLHRNVSEVPSTRPCVAALFHLLTRIVGDAGRIDDAHTRELDSWEDTHLFLYPAVEHYAAEARKVAAEASRAEVRMRELTGEMQAILQSRSWAVTRPLRFIASRLARSRRGNDPRRS